MMGGRARARDGPPADLTEPPLRGVRGACTSSTRAGQQPFFKAQLRKLRRLEDEYKALHPRPRPHPPPGDLRPSAGTCKAAAAA